MIQLHPAQVLPEGCIVIIGVAGKSSASDSHTLEHFSICHCVCSPEKAVLKSTIEWCLSPVHSSNFPLPKVHTDGKFSTLDDVNTYPFLTPLGMEHYRPCEMCFLFTARFRENPKLCTYHAFQMAT